MFNSLGTKTIKGLGHPRRYIVPKPMSYDVFISLQVGKPRQIYFSPRFRPPRFVVDDSCAEDFKARPDLAIGAHLLWRLSLGGVTNLGRLI